jgi:hypothetical protein
LQGADFIDVTQDDLGAEPFQFGQRSAGQHPHPSPIRQQAFRNFAADEAAGASDEGRKVFVGDKHGGGKLTGADPIHQGGFGHKKAQIIDSQRYSQGAYRRAENFHLPVRYILCLFVANQGFERIHQCFETLSEISRLSDS